MQNKKRKKKNRATFTFTNGLDKDRIVPSYNKAKASIVAVNDNDTRVRVGCCRRRHQVAVAYGSWTVGRCPLELWARTAAVTVAATTLISGPVGLVQPVVVKKRKPQKKEQTISPLSQLQMLFGMQVCVMHRKHAITYTHAYTRHNLNNHKSIYYEL